MALNEFELHPDRLATTDESGRRVFLHPADVKGRFRAWRSRIQLVLIVIFLALPWIEIDGRQALLLDLGHRKFEFFGLSLRAHNGPLLIFVLATLAFGLFFITAIWGRIWCGWACPQTVFIDGVFRRIERWIEGAPLARRKLDAAPWSWERIFKRALKWSAFTLVSLVLTHSFLAYFVGAERLSDMIASSPRENWASFLVMAVSTAIILFDFGWFREQFCTIACPYGRFQSLLMDSQSMIVAYDSNRGEPRASAEAKSLAASGGPKLGDCVNCYRCVQVCPTGVDIRRGVQMECIACTACIDACDEVMTKVKKPAGLIRYDSLRGLQGRPTHLIRPRTIIYLTVILGAIITLVTLLALMNPIDIAVLRAKDTPYRVAKAPDGTDSIVINHFKVELSNRSDSLHKLSFSAQKNTGESAGIELIMPMQPYSLSSGVVTHADFFVRFPRAILKNGQRKLALTIRSEDSESGQVLNFEKEITVVGPFE